MTELVRKSDVRLDVVVADVYQEFLEEPGATVAEFDEFLCYFVHFVVAAVKVSFEEDPKFTIAEARLILTTTKDLVRALHGVAARGGQVQAAQRLSVRTAFQLLGIAVLVFFLLKFAMLRYQTMRHRQYLEGERLYNMEILIATVEDDARLALERTVLALPVLLANVAIGGTAWAALQPAMDPEKEAEIGKKAEAPARRATHKPPLREP